MNTYFYFVRIIGKSSIIHCARNEIGKKKKQPMKNEIKRKKTTTNK